MPDILIVKDGNTLVPKMGVTDAQRLTWMRSFAIYDINADGSKSGPYGPTDAARESVNAYAEVDTNGLPTGQIVTPSGDVVGGGVAWTGRGPSRLLPSNGNVNIGAAVSNVTGFRTVVVQHPAIRPFSGVWLRFGHYNTSAGLTLQAARVTSTPVHLSTPNNDGALVWSSGAAAKVAGAALPYTSAAAVAGTSGGVIPAVFSTDRIPVTSVARTDSATHGSMPLLRSAVYINDGAVIPSLSSGNLQALNNLADNPGLKYGNFLYTSGTDGVTTLGSVSVGEFGGAMTPLEVVFDYDVPVRQVACFGDSNTQGTGTTSGWAAWPARMMFQAINDDVPISASNYANAGQRHADSINTAIAYMPSIAGTTKAAVFISGWSPNEGAASDEVMQACRANVLKAMARAREADLPLTVGTTPPVTGYTSSQKARVLTHNEWVRSLAAHGVRVLDIANLLAPAGVLLPEYDSDGTHWTDAAHIAVAALARTHFA